MLAAKYVWLSFPVDKLDLAATAHAMALYFVAVHSAVTLLFMLKSTNDASQESDQKGLKFFPGRRHTVNDQQKH